MPLGVNLSFRPTGNEQRKAAEGDAPAAPWRDGFVRVSALDGVAALPVLALRGHDLKLHPLGDRAAEVSTDRMRQPARGCHEFFQRSAVRLPQQAQDLGCLTALAGTGGRVWPVWRPFGFWAAVRPSWPSFPTLACRAQHGASVAQRWRVWWF